MSKKTASLGMFTRLLARRGSCRCSVLIAPSRSGDPDCRYGAYVTDAYYAMFRGAIVDPQASTFMRAIKPLTDSVFFLGFR